MKHRVLHLTDTDYQDPRGRWHCLCGLCGRPAILVWSPQTGIPYWNAPDNRVIVPSTNTDEWDSIWYCRHQALRLTPDQT